MFTNEQNDALQHAQLILQKAGLHLTKFPADLTSPSAFDIPNWTTSISSEDFPLHYTPSGAVAFTPEEILIGKNRVTIKTQVSAIVKHPFGAIVEFPETGNENGIAIAHLFPVDPSRFLNPKDNFQYSLGKPCSTHHNVSCLLLRDKDTGTPMYCKQTKATCCSLKKCTFNLSEESKIRQPVILDAWGEVFMKTLGFFCALREHGCSFSFIFGGDKNLDNSDDSATDDADTSTANRQDLLLLKCSRSPRKKKTRVCQGILLLEQDRFGHFFIRCEHFNSKGRRNHLRLRNLNEYDINYLSALFYSDHVKIHQYESAAAQQGYGPLVPCDVTAVARGQKELCPMWHRNTNGTLQRGRMVMSECKCSFEIYQPNNLSQCPFILIVSRNPHSHSSPLRTKTPEAIRQTFRLLLEPLSWKLADATPRRILLDNGFMQGLRSVLKWTDIRDPGLGNLHPSLANHDHTARIIDELRYDIFPNGTGLEGAKHLLDQHLKLSPEEQYIRCVKTFQLPGEGAFTIIICMFRAMSRLLIKTKRLSIDTSFKRVHSWQEFEIEAWFSEYSRSVVLARAITTSQSAIAHQELFKLIFSIVELDTGEKVLFRHIHGSGIDTVTADGHRGQALGFGLYLQETCQHLTTCCPIEGRPLHTLSPLDHLCRFYRYCFTHFYRNVQNLRGHVQENVISAMMSLASPNPLPNLDGTLALIRSGGKKATEWLKDKESSFAFAAIYQPASKIPLEIWKAAPSTSNGNEQAHRNINRDGTKLTLLAGIMRGFQFDAQAMRNITIYIEERIHQRDQISTHFQCLTRAIRIKSSFQERIVIDKDREITELFEKAKTLQNAVISAAAMTKRTLEAGNNLERPIKRLKTSDERLQETHNQLLRLLPQGSGSVSLIGLHNPLSLFDRRLLNHQLQSAKKNESLRNSTASVLSSLPHPPPVNAAHTVQADIKPFTSQALTPQFQEYSSFSSFSPL